MSNRSKSTQFRELVSLYLQVQGIPAEPKPDNHGQLPAELRDGEAGHIRGLDSWLVNVRNEGQRDLSGALDSAEVAAEIGGKPLSAVVFHRASRSPGEHYVLMSLDTFAKVLAMEQTP